MTGELLRTVDIVISWLAVLLGVGFSRIPPLHSLASCVYAESGDGPRGRPELHTALGGDVRPQLPDGLLYPMLETTRPGRVSAGPGTHPVSRRFYNRVTLGARD